MKWIIYWCSISSSAIPCHTASGTIQVDHLVTAYVHPYGYTDFEIVEADYVVDFIHVEGKKVESITKGIFHLKHPHGHGVMHITPTKIVLYVSLTSEQTKFQDTQIFTRKSSTRTCKCKK